MKSSAPVIAIGPTVDRFTRPTRQNILRVTGVGRAVPAMQYLLGCGAASHLGRTEGDLPPGFVSGFSCSTGGGDGDHSTAAAAEVNRCGCASPGDSISTRERLEVGCRGTLGRRGFGR